MTITPRPSEAKCNNSQRKAWATLAEDKFSRAKEIVDRKNNMVQGEVDIIVLKKLGVDLMNIEISKLREQLEKLEEKKRELIGHGYTSDSISATSKAGRLKEKLLADHDPDLRDMYSKKNEVLTKIWAAQTIGEGMGLVNEIDEIINAKYKALDSINIKMLKE